MAIDITYKEILLEKYIKEQLSSGETLNADAIAELLDSWNDSHDFTVPQFKASDFILSRKEEASASKFVSASDALFTDLKVLMKELDRLTKLSLSYYERWDNEFDMAERSLEVLEAKVGNLLLLKEDTEGYINFVGDNFTDFSKVAQSSTTVEVDPISRTASIAPSVRNYHPVDLSAGDKKVSFSLLTPNGQSQTGTENNLSNIFSDLKTFWLSKAYFDSAKAVTGELILDVGEGFPEVSKLFIRAHASNKSSPLVVTPLISLNGYNYSQLPGRDISQEVVDSVVFTFQPVAFRFLKLILTKKAPDYFQGGKFFYEFGAKLVQLFTETFDIAEDLAEPQVLVSEPLSVEGFDGEPIEFSALSLETCESVPDDTSLRYFVAVSNNGSFPLSPEPNWIPIDPFGRREKENSAVVDVGDLQVVEIGDTESVAISYDAGGDPADGMQNPDGTFRLIGYDSAVGEFTDTEIVATVNRYMLLSSNDRVLNYEFKCPKDPAVVDVDDTYFLIDFNELQIFRNIGEQGLTGQANELVRGVQRGWKYEDPYYSCVIKIENVNGLAVDAGPEMWVDDEPRSGLFTVPYGMHSIKILKSNWAQVNADYTTLADLIAADDLYPYNHKLLIEGYQYGAGFDSNEKVYVGADLFAECLMKRVKTFDFINNIPEKDFTRFAVDYDIPGSYLNTYGNMVFLVKVDEDYDDCENERFWINFKAIDERFKYLRLKAIFETNSSSLTPVLSSYKIKVR